MWIYQLTPLATQFCRLVRPRAHLPQIRAIRFIQMWVFDTYLLIFLIIAVLDLLLLLLGRIWSYSGASSDFCLLRWARYFLSCRFTFLSTKISSSVSSDEWSVTCVVDSDLTLLFDADAWCFQVRKFVRQSSIKSPFFLVSFKNSVLLSLFSRALSFCICLKSPRDPVKSLM